MPLCSCGYVDICPGDIMYTAPRDYKQFDMKRATRCGSCDEFVRPGSLALEFQRYKVPENDVERNIYGETDENGPPRSSIWLCERCADLYFSLAELGYCVGPYEDLRETVREYAEMRPIRETLAATENKP